MIHSVDIGKVYHLVIHVSLLSYSLPTLISLPLSLSLSLSSLSLSTGNNGSAFIEVLVGNSTGSGGDSTSDYEVLIVASSFMSPVESKSWSNINRVRMFGKEREGGR